MSTRDLLVLGTASAVPTKFRNHNGYLVRWDGQGLLFDPGEGTQRQMIRAGVAAHDIDWICVTHFHGDHCLGLPGVIQRIARDGVEHPVRAVFPASGRDYWERLRHASAFVDTDVVEERPIGGAQAAIDSGEAPFTLSARRLQHPVEAYGYRLEEPDGITMLPERLAGHGIAGPLVGRLQREGRVTAPDGRTVTLAECSVPRPGQKLAFVMDTRLCDAVFELADGVDMLIIESTFLAEDEPLARRYAHLTARQAGEVAAAGGVRRLVLTHFSERYTAEDFPRFAEQAAEVYDGDVVLARDLDRIPVPSRHRATGA
ncbi:MULTISPECIES: ribonuclease Z [Thermomonospora]|uniref:Ribonuclease Z n=1 Tax=Thermomonospora cellulosilytica TaxID=1411118 RepID=A0A7W3MXC1_9ACTN|nr:MULTISPECIES: ribonuclease Z [Thermomonospora]MBA9003625.1 ribonuclease Z [Thermomonospora cellulosilytica]